MSRLSRTARSNPTDSFDIQLSEKQARFVYDEHQFAAFIGGVGSGKSVAGSVKALLQGYLNTPQIGLVIAPSYTLLQDSTIRVALQYWEPLIERFYERPPRALLRTGAEILFRSADEPDSLRAISASWAWIDEAAYCEEQTWRNVIARLRQGGRLGRAWVTTTPKGFNWVYRVFVEQAESLGAALYQASTRENPFVDEAYYRALAADYSEEYARQELEGEFLEFGAGMIDPKWWYDAPDRIVYTAPDTVRWVRFWDLAVSEKTTADYTVSFLVGLDPETGDLYVAEREKGRWAWPETRQRILARIEQEPNVEVGIEAVGFQQAAVQDLLADPRTLGATIRGIPITRDKINRAQPWISRAQAGKVKLVRGDWIRDTLTVWGAFPTGRHDDDVDAISGAFEMLRAGHSGAAVRGFRRDFRELTGRLQRSRRLQRYDHDPRGRDLEAELYDIETDLRLTPAEREQRIAERRAEYADWLAARNPNLYGNA